MSPLWGLRGWGFRFSIDLPPLRGSGEPTSSFSLPLYPTYANSLLLFFFGKTTKIREPSCFEKNEVIKASPAIQIQSDISLLQRRAWNVLLANAYNELPNKDIYTVSMVELAAKLGFDSKNEQYLKETLGALVDCTVKWNLLNKNKID